MRKFLVWMLVGLVAICAVGLSKIRLSTDILDVLPDDVAGVEALQRLQAQAESQNQLILIFEGDTGIPLPEDDAFRALAEKLAGVPGTERVRWEDGLGDMQSAGDWATVVAYLWANAPEDVVAAKLGHVSGGAALGKHLKRTVRRLATSMDEIEVARRSYDPLGFLEHPFIVDLIERAPSFMSEDGDARIVMLKPESDLLGYKDFGAWSERVRDTVRSEMPGTRAWITGAPAIAAEIGGGLEGDLAGTMLVTALLVAGLFILFQRSPRQLVALLICLTLTIVTALGICGWVWGTLSLVSGGFAAILLGLCVDYAMVVGREVTLESSVTGGQKRAAPGVFWAALTTASVFAACMMSALPGIRQLGGLVAAGLVAGALLMVLLYPLLAFGGNSKQPVRQPLVLPIPRIAPRTAFAASAGGILLIAAALATVGLPGIDFDPARFRPENSETQDGYAKLREHFPEWGEESITLLVRPALLAASPDPAAERTAFEADVAALQDDGLANSLTIPHGVLPLAGEFPSAEFFDTVLASQEELSAAIREAGFNDRATAFFESTCTSLHKLLAETPSVAFEGVSQHPAIFQAILPPDGVRGVLRLDSNRGALLSEADHAAVRALDRPWVQAAGWPLLRHDVRPVLSRDSWRVSTPVILVLGTALFVVFRNTRDTFVAVLVMALCLGAVALLVRSTAGVWHLTSVLCIPLLAGTGVDYIIHLTFALRRENGDVRRVLSGTGMAVLFCALSTAVGFGSLLFASNHSIRDLGLVASGGILMIGVACLLLVPALWGRGRNRR